MPTPWDHKADKDLLLTIIAEGSLKSIDWQKVASSMVLKGYTFTHEASRQHFQKIRVEARKGTTTTGGDQATPNNAKSAKATPSAKRAHNKAFNNGDHGNGDDEEVLAQTPVKRKQAPKKQKVDDDNGGLGGLTAAQFKVEEGYGEPVIVDDDDEIYV